MAANMTVPNNFTNGTPADADEVDANFDAVTTWTNLNAVHLDASKAFTGVPSGPAGVNPTAADQLARKGYVDGAISDATTGFTRCGGIWRRMNTGQSINIGAKDNIVMDSEIEDTDGFGTATGTTFTVPAGKAGIYVIDLFISWASGGTNTSIAPGLSIVSTAFTGDYNAGEFTDGVTAHHGIVNMTWCGALQVGSTVTGRATLSTSAFGAATFNAGLQLWRVSP